MRWLYTLAAGLLTLPALADPPSPVRLDAISYADLTTELKAMKGKVVLVDVWGTFCAPCREKFPKVVALHDLHARSGLAVVSVSVDPPDDPAAREAAKAFLAKQKAVFRNVILTDKAEIWQDKWKAVGPPLLFLFDRKGQLIARWDDKVDLADVERRVKAILAE
jgi:thiol-disulfide isomerase/thioredoxin